PTGTPRRSRPLGAGAPSRALGRARAAGSLPGEAGLRRPCGSEPRARGGGWSGEDTPAPPLPSRCSGRGDDLVDLLLGLPPQLLRERRVVDRGSERLPLRVDEREVRL